MRKILLSLLLTAIAGCAGPAGLQQSGGQTADLPAGARYVAMGSSYAAGLNIGAQVPDTPARCARAVNNYAHLLAAAMKLDLVDASCSGAVTDHILRPWNELPAQVAAVTPETRLVTVTIGGNDVGYVLDLFRAVCLRGLGKAAGRPCPPAQPVTEQDWTKLEGNMHAIVRDIRARAPGARIVFVDYLKIVPEHSSCASVPLTPEQLAVTRAKFDRLAKLTAKVARDEHVALLPAGKLSERHDGCSSDRWAEGFPATAAPWHPTAAGHAAVAAALERMLAPRTR